MTDTLKINPEFERLIPPLTQEEFELLKENILSENEIFTPIFTWNGYIIDGHHRYKILSEHKDIKYRVTEKDFENKYEAMSWICANQLGRRNLTKENKKYLIGKRYDAEKMAYGASDGFRGNRHTKLVSDKDCHLLTESTPKTRKRIADESKVSEGYVMYADQFAKGVDAAEEVVPGIKKEILSGSIKKPATQIAAIAKASPEDRKALTENLSMAKTVVKPTKNTIDKIKSIRTDMRKDKPVVSDESAIESLDGAVKMMIECCESIFVSHPKLLLDDNYLSKVMEIMQNAIQYISKLKGGNNGVKKESG